MPLIIEQTNYHHLNGSQQAAIGRAINTWSQHLNSVVPLRIEVFGNVNLPGFSAMCISNIFLNTRNPIENIVNNTWYVSALADRLAGRDLQPQQPDIFVFFDINRYNWYDGIGQPQADQFDLETIALHELCHGLGFMSLFLVIDMVGDYGNQDLMNFLPQGVQHILIDQLGQLPQLNSSPSIYDRQIVNQTFEYLTDPNSYPNNSPQLGNALIHGPLNFYIVPNTQYSIFTQDPFIPFTSIVHLNPMNFPNSLMRPHIAAGEVIRQVNENDPIIPMLNSLGWR